MEIRGPQSRTRRPRTHGQRYLASQSWKVYGHWSHGSPVFALGRGRSAIPLCRVSVRLREGSMTNERDWEPSASTAQDTVLGSSARALHGLLDSPGEAPRTGDRLPPLWHWLAFRPDVAQRDLADDGHPKVGEFMPPTNHPRRMFAGGRLEFRAPITIGEQLVRQSSVTSISDKVGRSGPLRFVTVRHEVGIAADLAITEEQDIVYLHRGGSMQDAEADHSRNWTWHWDLPIDPTLLFRFSALTYNAHRIHYDRHFATEVEGYPGLVVQGPLQAVAACELIRRNLPHHNVRLLSFRARRPVFDDGPLLIRGRMVTDHIVELATMDHESRLALLATAHLDPQPKLGQ